jgi:membrane protein implicated in regulation of membrane protease activity
MGASFWFWLILAGVFAVMEVLTLAFFAAFLAAAALGAALASAIGLPLLWQTVIFAALGLLGVLGARPVVLRTVRSRREPQLESGADAMVGQRAVLQEAIEGLDRPGHVFIAGEKWPAITADGSVLPANTHIVVVALKSTTLVVQPAPQTGRSTA